MTTYSFDTVLGQTIAFDVDADDLNIAYGAGDVTLTETGGNLIVSVANIGSVTLTGVSIAQLVGSGTNQNISVASGTLYVGDNTTSDALDELANDNVDGGTGADLLYGMGGADSIDSGTAGTDIIFGGSGITDANDTGTDVIDVRSTDAVKVYANAGDDRVDLDGITSSGESSSIWGGLGDDTVGFDLGADAAGDDYAGDYTVVLASGDDQFTTASASTVSGSLNIAGGAGGDTLTFTNTSGDVTVYGGTGTADSTDGADTITLGTGNATVYGNAGNDTIDLGVHTSTKTVYVNAGTGNDDLDNDGVNFVGATTLAGGWGNDDIDVNSNAATSLVVYGGNGLTDANSSEGDDNIEIVDGGALATAKIYGNAGADTITFTGAGDDAGAATINGGLGNDSITATLTNTDTATINVGAGNDTVTLITAVGDDGTFTIEGYDTSDSLTLNFNDSSAGDMSVATGSSSTVIDDGASEGAVVLDGYTGNLNLTMNDGTVIRTNTTATAETISGSDDALGGDYLQSGAAGDTFLFDDATSDLTTADDVIGGAGDDTIQFSNADTGIADADFTNVLTVEAVVLGDGANTMAIGDQFEEAGIVTIDGSASTGILTLSDGAVTDVNYIITDGSAAANIDLEEATGDITYTLGAGADDLVSGSGDDTIDTGIGDDSVTGGAGADTITLGAGSDDVRYAGDDDGSTAGTSGGTFSGYDVVTGFTTGTDDIDIDISEVLDGSNSTDGTLDAGDTGTVGTTTNAAITLASDDTDELMIFSGADDSQLTSVNYVTNAMNALIASGSFTSATGDTALIVFNGSSGSALYLFTEDGTGAGSSFNAGDFQLLGTFDSSLAAGDFNAS